MHLVGLGGVSGDKLLLLRMNRPYRQRAPPHESYGRNYEGDYMTPSYQDRDYYRGPPSRRERPAHHQYDAYREDTRPRARRLNDAYPPEYRERPRHPRDLYPPPYREDPRRPNNQYRQPPHSREYIRRHKDYRPRESSYPPPRRRQQQSAESVCTLGIDHAMIDILTYTHNSRNAFPAPVYNTTNRELDLAFPSSLPPSEDELMITAVRKCTAIPIKGGPIHLHLSN